MYAFLAIPKTGCDSLSEALSGVFSTANTLAINKPLVMDDIQPNLSGIALLRGHFGVLDVVRHGLWSPSMVMLSCFRDPVERSISTYRYAVAKAQNQMDAAPAHESDLEIAKLSFREFVDRHLFPDEQLMWLSGTGSEEELDYDQVMHNIVKHVAHVGITEDLDSFCLLLSRVYGWTLFPSWHRNVTTVRAVDISVTEQDLAAVRAKCAKDIRAYDYFQARFKESVRAFGIPQRTEISDDQAIVRPQALGLQAVSKRDRGTMVAFAKAFIAAAESADQDQKAAAVRYYDTARAFVNEAANFPDSDEELNLLRLSAQINRATVDTLASPQDPRTRAALELAIASCSSAHAIGAEQEDLEALGKLYLQTGRLSAEIGEEADATANFQSANAAFSQLLTAEPTNPRFACELAATYSELACVRMDRGETKEASDLINSAATVYEQALSRNVERELVLLEYAEHFLRLAGTKRNRTSPEAAENFRRALVLLNQLDDANANSRKALVAHERAYAGLATFSAETGDRDSEAAEMRSLISVLGRLHELEPRAGWDRKIGNATQRLDALASGRGIRSRAVAIEA